MTTMTLLTITFAAISVAAFGAGCAIGHAIGRADGEADGIAWHAKWTRTRGSEVAND